jgi:iron(III) transport system substrate-binding protein
MNDDTLTRLSAAAPRATLPRRGVLGLLAVAGAAGLARPALAAGPLDDRARLSAARGEGPLVVMHADQENDIVAFLKAFSETTGIEAVQQRALPGVAMPKLQAELRAGASNVDLWMNSDAGLMDVLRERRQLLRYESPEIAAYGSEFRSTEPGWWTAYFINVGPMMYDTRHVQASAAPKTWADLLQPAWKQQVGFQNSAAGTQYTWWFVLRDVLPASFWTSLAEQKPRAYASSTQIITDILNGSLKIGGKVSSYQYVKARRLQQPVNAIYPPEGTPAQGQVVGIISGTKRPNASKIFVDYLLSQEGQTVWNRIQGSPSARGDVRIEDVPPLSDFKILMPRDFAEYRSPARHSEFVRLWNQITGM